jgi:hypothetical protein
MRIPNSMTRGAPRFGHQHFWQRAFSRRAFLRTSVGVAGAATAVALTPAWLAEASNRPLGRSSPKPIPSGIQPGGPGTPVFHIQFPGMGSENSSITDFDGMVGFADVQGTGTTRDGRQLLFDSDMRFMKGTYIDQGGRTRSGTFAFV